MFATFHYFGYVRFLLFGVLEVRAALLVPRQRHQPVQPDRHVRHCADNAAVRLRYRATDAFF